MYEVRDSDVTEMQDATELETARCNLLTMHWPQLMAYYGMHYCYDRRHDGPTVFQTKPRRIKLVR